MSTSRSNAFKFIILLGIVSLFSDITYEGAWSINGQYLAILGASGTIIGITAGFGFGLHEALDQIGAILGPAIVAFIFYLKWSYQNCFVLLLLPALIALSVLFVAKLIYSNPHDFEVEKIKLKSKRKSKFEYPLYI